MSKTLQANTYKDMKRYYLSCRRWSKTSEERKAEERLQQEMKERNLHGQESEEKNAVDGEVTDAVQEPSKSDGGQEPEVLSEGHPNNNNNNNNTVRVQKPEF